MKKISLLLVCALLFSYFTAFSTLAAENFTNAEIVKEVAYAYYRKGTNIHYDQATTTARRQISLSPEDVSSQRRAYLDCSGYARAVYHEAFGAEILPEAASEKRPSTANYYEYASENPGNADVVGAWVLADYSGKKEELKEIIKNNLKVGDVFTLRYTSGSNTAGHTLIFVGANENGEEVLLHCYGGTSYVIPNTKTPWTAYDTDEIEATIPAIDELKLDDLLNNVNERYYLFRTENPLKHICILRPLAKNLEQTAETAARMKIKGLSMEKTSDPYEHNAVSAGEDITYTVYLKNTTESAIDSVKIADSVPEGTVFKSGTEGVRFTGGQISWTGLVPAGEIVNVSYTVSVTATKRTVITSDDTYVSGVKLATIKHTLSLISDEDIKKVADYAIKLAENGETSDSILAFINSAYKEVLGIDVLFGYSGVTAFFNDVLNLTTGNFNEASAPAKVIVPDLYGGIGVVPDELDIDNDRTRLISEEELEVGDIIITNYDGSLYPGGADSNNRARAFYYVGNSTLINLPQSTKPIQAITIGDDIYGADADNELISLFAYKRFAVVRPSMAHSVGEISALSVSDVINKAVTSTNPASVEVQGYFVGITREGPASSNEEELLIKDIETNDVIAIRTLDDKSVFPTGIEYKYGDHVTVKGTLKEDASATNKKKYILMSKTSGKWDWNKLSGGNSVVYDFSEAVEISSQDEIDALIKDNKIKPYTYVKITGTTFSGYAPSTANSSVAPHNYRLHKDKTANDIYDYGWKNGSAYRTFAFNGDIMTENLGVNWYKMLYENPGDYQTRDDADGPGTVIDRDFYAIYTGGNTYYAQLVILEEDWILNENKIIGLSDSSISAQFKKAGEFTAVLADYNGAVLKNVEFITIEATSPGNMSFTRTKNFELGKDDKIMLLDNLKSLEPLCKPYVFE